MVKRLISANTSDLFKMSASELKQSIKASEGRTILAENVTMRETVVGDVTNAEIARAFGADLILLNGFDVFHPYVSGLYPLDATGLIGSILAGTVPAKPDELFSKDTIKDLKKLCGRPVGVNLEPVDANAKMAEDKLEISAGRQATEATFKEAEALGFDFICLTGNPGTGVTNHEIIKSLQLAKKHFSGLIIAGKMHGAGVEEAIVDEETIKAFVTHGADIILVPAVGTVPGFDEDQLKEAVAIAHKADALVMTAIGTSQESSDEDTIKQIAIRNKICGVDIQHIGDAGYGGVAPVENIFAMSKALRGARHTISMISRSINR